MSLCGRQNAPKPVWTQVRWGQVGDLLPKPPLPLVCTVGLAPLNALVSGAHGKRAGHPVRLLRAAVRGRRDQARGGSGLLSCMGMKITMVDAVMAKTVMPARSPTPPRSHRFPHHAQSHEQEEASSTSTLSRPSVPCGTRAPWRPAPRECRRGSGCARPGAPCAGSCSRVAGGGHLREWLCEAVAVAAADDRPLSVRTSTSPSPFDEEPTIATLEISLGLPWPETAGPIGARPPRGPSRRPVRHGHRQCRRAGCVDGNGRRAGRRARRRHVLGPIRGRRIREVRR